MSYATGGDTYIQKLFLVSLKFQFNWRAYIFFAKSANPRSSGGPAPFLFHLNPQRDPKVDAVSIPSLQMIKSKLKEGRTWLSRAKFRSSCSQSLRSISRCKIEISTPVVGLQES